MSPCDTCGGSPLRLVLRAANGFTLRQSFEARQYHQKLIAECETELRKQMDGLADQTKEAAPPPARPDKRCDEKTRQDLFEKFGVVLTAVDAVKQAKWHLVTRLLGLPLNDRGTRLRDDDDHFDVFRCNLISRDRGKFAVGPAAHEGAGQEQKFVAGNVLRRNLVLQI